MKRQHIPTSSLLFLAVLGFAPLGGAYESPSGPSGSGPKGEVNPIPWLSKTGGSWTDESGHGYFHVRIFRKPGDAAEDSIEIRIVQIDDKRGELRTVKVISLGKLGYKGTVENVELFDGDTLTVLKLDISMRGMYGITMPELFLLSSSGAYERVYEAPYIDLGAPLYGGCRHDCERDDSDSAVLSD